MKQTLNCYVTEILLLFSTSITCAQTTTTGGAGAGGEGADPLKVELFATPLTQIVGYQVDLTAEASGGKPKYIYGFSMTCDIAGPAAIEGNVWKTATAPHATFDLPQPGKLKALVLVLDQDNNSKFAEKVVTIQPPDKIKLVDPVVSVKPVGNKLLDVMFLNLKSERVTKSSDLLQLASDKRKY